MTDCAKVEDIANKHFDYIVIGGGATGSALAARLSEKSDITVLVLEAGKMHINDPLIDIPSGFFQQFGKPEYDWAFQTTPQKKLGGKSVVWSRGKGLGGSSNMNFMAWTHPGKDEIDAWERLGNPGWSYENFIPYIRKSERFHFPSEEIIERDSLAVEPSSFGKNGPIDVSFTDWYMYPGPIVRAALNNLGIPSIKDPVNGKYCGTWTATSSVNPVTLTRSSAFTSYLQPNMGRSNLSVVAEAYVTRLLLDGDSNEPVSAKGVEFKHGEDLYVVYAGKEVLLCAGALKSPQVLELSGIGDPNILKPLGIDVRVNLPGVGTNVQEHISNISISFELNPDTNIQTLDMLSDPVEFQKFNELYQQKRAGLLSTTVTGFSFLPLQAISPQADAIIARLEERLASNELVSQPGLREQYKIQLERLKNPEMPDCEIITFPVFNGFINQVEPGKRYVSFILIMATPWSRGTAHITSKDPLVNPALDGNILGEEVDLDIMVEIFKFTRALGSVEPFKNIIAKEANPGPTVSTDDQVKEHICENISSVWHTSSTLSMLPRENGGVVDPSLKVWGTKNIRVCDLSILPLLVGVHTQSIAYGIAEKAADIILGRV